MFWWGPFKKTSYNDIPHICYLSIRLIRVYGIRLDRVSLLLGHADVISGGKGILFEMVRGEVNKDEGITHKVTSYIIDYNVSITFYIHCVHFHSTISFFRWYYDKRFQVRVSSHSCSRQLG
jgi:hypothetical protein